MDSQDQSNQQNCKIKEIVEEDDDYYCFEEAQIGSYQPSNLEDASTDRTIRRNKRNKMIISINTSNQDELNKSIKQVVQHSQFTDEIDLQILADILAKNKYFLNEYLASGGFCDIYNGYFEAESNKRIFKLQKYKELNEVDSIKQEFEKIKSIKDCSHIVKYYDLFVIPERKMCIIVMEKCIRSLLGDFRDHLEKKCWYTTQEILKMIFNLFHGLIEMKNNFICHLDIKPQNILISQNGDYIYCDFGISSILFAQKKFAQNGIYLTYGYNSPEQIQKNSSISFSSDIYSLAIVLLKITEVWSKYVDQKSEIPFLIKQINQFIHHNMLQSNINERMQCEILPVNFCLAIDIKQYHPLYENLREKIITILSKPIFKGEEDYELIGTIDYEGKFKMDGDECNEIYDEKNINKNEQNMPSKSLAYLNYAFLELITIKGYHSQINSLELNNLQSQKWEQQMNMILSGESIEIAQSLQRIGHCFFKSGIREIAYIFLKRALSIRESLAENKIEEIVNCLIILGHCLCALENGWKALEIAQRGLDLILPSQNQDLISDCYNNMGYANFELKEYGAALECFEKALDIKKKFEKSKFGQNANVNLKENIATKIILAKYFNNIGLCYLYLKNLKKAKQYLNESYSVRDEYYKEVHIEKAVSFNSQALLCFKSSEYLLQNSYNLFSEANLYIHHFYSSPHFDKMKIMNNLFYVEKILGLHDKRSLNVGQNFSDDDY